MSTTPTLVLLQQSITRYGLSTIVALGNLGNLIAIGVFAQKKHRASSFSIYLLAVSVFGLIAANWGIIPLVYRLDHFDLLGSSLIFCRIRGYTIHVNGLCFRYTLILMCADRYALCNSRAGIRALCRPQIAYRSIATLVLFCMVVSVHLLILESIENGQCSVYGIYGIVFGAYSLIFTGILPISAMTVLGVLLLRELRHLRSRVRSLHHTGRLNRRDRNLIKLVLVEVLIYTMCTFLYPIVYLYTTITNTLTPTKSVDRKQIEAFISFLSLSLLLYLNYNITFYIHLLTSRTYRKETKQFLLKLSGQSNRVVPIQANTLQFDNQMRTRQHPPQVTSIV